MRNQFQKFAQLAILSMFALTACDSKSGNDLPKGFDGVNLKGTFSENITLESGKTYTLTGGVAFESGATLNIQDGVKIVANSDVPTYILIKQGAKINAVGTAQRPIVMTADKEVPGAWGGIHICGKATINVEGGTAQSEIAGVPYGGNDDNDNSGVLKYIRLEYTGYSFSEDQECNGVTFYGVGRGTEVDYIQSFHGSDDGFEWFGGTVNVKHLVATNNSDDSFDWTQGWRGKAQFLVATQAAKASLGYECDCLMECDNNADDIFATPVACPIISNATLVGNSSDQNTRGVRLRAGTHVKLYNTIITGKVNSITIETKGTDESLFDGSSLIKHVIMNTFKDATVNDIAKPEKNYVAKFTQDRIDSSNTFTEDFSFLKNTYVGTVEGGDDLSVSDSFFTSTNYKGAVQEGSDWTLGWTRR